MLLLACTPEITCGPGTTLKDQTCVVADSGAPDSETDTDTDTDTDSDTDSDTDADTDADTDSDADADPGEDGWPVQVFSPFVDATAYPTPKIADIGAETGIRYYNLGFIVSDGSCNATWGTYYSIESGPESWDGGSSYTLYDHIDSLRALGGDVAVSFGGAAGTPLAAACSDVSSLKAQIRRVVDQLDLHRIDFDVEGTWLADHNSVSRRNQAIAALQADLAGEGRSLAVWYTLPVLPSGLTADGEWLLADALDKGVGLSGVNIMTMDYGDGAAPNPSGQMGEYGIQAVEALKDQLALAYRSAGASKTDAELWPMLGTTPMIGLNDVTTELFDVEDAQQTLDFAVTNKLGMISMWSINRDHGCPDQDWVSVDCSSNAEQSGDWAYTQVWVGY